jgi:glutathione synthase/RimK-type ligase-like ATP-grasp enzyme
MKKIAVMTPDPADPSYASQWPGVLERLSASLLAGGFSVEAQPWTDHVEDASHLAGFDLILPLIVWGYHRDHLRWLQACASWSAANLPMANPPGVLAWNADKSYLRRLAERGIPIAPTIWVDAVSQADVDAAFNAFATDQVVVKPTVSGGAYLTARLSRGDVLDQAPDGAAMIQPYLPSIETEGETSLLFFGGRLSHAVNKRPVGGDFRIQVQYGGQYVAVTPPPEAVALAQRVLAEIDEPLLYARIDMAQGVGGRWLLMEAELIEPDFYLSTAPDGGANFVQAVRAQLA